MAVYKTGNEDFSKEFYSVKELAAALDISPNTVKNMIKRGDLDFYRIGRQIRIPAAQMGKFKNLTMEFEGVPYTHGKFPDTTAGQDFRGPEEYEDGPAAAQISEDKGQ